MNPADPQQSRPVTRRLRSHQPRSDAKRRRCAMIRGRPVAAKGARDRTALPQDLRQLGIHRCHESHGPPKPSRNSSPCYLVTHARIAGRAGGKKRKRERLGYDTRYHASTLLGPNLIQRNCDGVYVHTTTGGSGIEQ